MNAWTKPDSGEQADVEPKARRSLDQERRFLPAALEILETPPSPVRIVLLLVICSFFAIALIWSALGRIDIVATAAGKIQPSGRVKTVQPIEAGRISSVLVSQGSQVQAGEVLLQLESREARSDVAQLMIARGALKAEAARRRAALASAKDPARMAEIRWDDDVPPHLRDREQLVLSADLAQLRADIDALEAQRIQKVAEQRRVENVARTQKELIDLEAIRVAMRTELLARNAGSKALVVDAEEAKKAQEVTLAGQLGQLIEIEAALEVVDKNKDRAIQTFLAENGQKLAAAERDIDDIGQRLEKARAKLENMTITAPIAGTVTALAVRNVGQVVAVGDELLRLVPENLELEVEANLLNRDVGFLEIGQRAVVKIEAFPFTRYGALDGTVVRVARDALPEPEIQQQDATPSRNPRSAGGGGTQRVQNLVYPITIRLDRQAIVIEGREVPLSPGMAVTAEITTGNRSFLNYLLSPLTEIGSASFKER